MNDYPLWPPGYNGGFCDDYDWEEYDEEFENTSNDLLAKIVEITRKGYLVYFDDDAGSIEGSTLKSLRIKLINCRTWKKLSRIIFLGKSADFDADAITLEVIAMLDTMVKSFEEGEGEKCNLHSCLF